MSGKGNRGFADLIAGEGGRAAGAHLPPRTGVLAGRGNRLAELASGTAVTRIHELIDPARCRIWEAHNRDYRALDETACGDLIESMKSQGRQEVPAIVRRVTGSPGIDYEVICGARRHWTVTWLRAHDHPKFPFLVEPREMSDEEAFRVSDLENRSRKDLTDHERAADYARAIDRYYEGSQQRMAERLNVSKSWLSRYLELAKLPPVIVGAFGSPAALGISHGAKLAPLLRIPVTRKRMEETAEALGAEQAIRRAAGRVPMPAAEVVTMLVEAKRKAKPKLRHAAVTATDDPKRVIASGTRTETGALTITIPAGQRDPAAILESIRDLLDQLS